MRAVSEWEVADLQSLVDNKIEENLTLDYKESKALATNDGAKKEIAKDVSALANSAGGILIYGVVEQDHLPVRVDDGVDPRVVTREWLENVITSRIQPRINGVIIRPITLASSNVCYAVEVPQATSSAPHQADHRYYKRFNFKSQPMEDYEIKDIMRRSTTPDLSVDVELDNISPVQDGFSGDLVFKIVNESSQPAFYVTLNLFLDAELNIPHLTDYTRHHQNVDIDGTQRMDVYSRNFGPTGHQPFYKEQRFNVGRATIPLIKPDLAYYWVTNITTPGMHKQVVGILVVENNKPTIRTLQRAV